MKIEIRIGDVLDHLKEMPDESVHCVVTSPPYWGLRDYGTADWVGGDPECDHMGKPFAIKANINRNCGTGTDRKNTEDREFFKETCGKCGARRVDLQIGLEPTPDAYLENMVAVFREIRRVLRKDGTCWMNMGDSFQDKQLCMMPARLAIALQADGWWLRSDIIWAKPNPMPESCTDRPTKSHEHMFLLTKSAKYFYDADAVRVPHAKSSYARAKSDWKHSSRNGDMTPPGTDRRWNTKKLAYNFSSGANLRDVWTIPTQPYPEAHFATYPEKLIEPCIRAGCPEDGTVLDPFSGSGTTGVVSQKWGRNYIGIELNPEYAAMSQRRIEKQAGLFT